MSAIKPALKANEWAEFLAPENSEWAPLVYGENMSDHSAAAVALHEQPFGFTRSDAFNHRTEASALRRRAESDKVARLAMLGVADWHESMADRIEALLPPEEK